MQLEDVIILPTKTAPVAYHLYAVTEHMGASARSGHYRAHLLNEARKWWCADDRFVSIQQCYIEFCKVSPGLGSKIGVPEAPSIPNQCANFYCMGHKGPQHLTFTKLFNNTYSIIMVVQTEYHNPMCIENLLILLKKKNNYKHYKLQIVEFCRIFHLLIIHSYV